MWARATWYTESDSTNQCTKAVQHVHSTCAALTHRCLPYQPSLQVWCGQSLMWTTLQQYIHSCQVWHAAIQQVSLILGLHQLHHCHTACKPMYYLAMWSWATEGQAPKLFTKWLTIGIWRFRWQPFTEQYCGCMNLWWPFTHHAAGTCLWSRSTTWPSKRKSDFHLQLQV